MSTIINKLEEARKELLDLGLRNPLINFRRLKARGLHIIDELPKEVYRILVLEGKSMSFLPVSDTFEHIDETDEEDDIKFVQPEEDEEPAARHLDTKLQTSHTPERLQKRLLKTYYAARTHIEEQGVNVLYMALGMLEWYESSSSSIVRRAPLILIPVELFRTSVQSRFRVRYTGEDIGDNLSLRAKLKAEFGINIPELDDEPIDIRAYFNAVEQAIASMERWRVDKAAIEIGFFSFGKFLMFNDLDPNSWPDNLSPEKHEVLRALLVEGFASESHLLDDGGNLDNVMHDVAHVVDADSSQALAIMNVFAGHNLVIQGPPGTGKSQTITNLIAEAINKGKTVLFVSEKMAALEVVKRRLDTVGLGDACLELHSHKTNKKNLLQELKRTLELGQPDVLSYEVDQDLLAEIRTRLNAYSEAVNTPIGTSGVTPYQAYGYILDIQQKYDDQLTLLQVPNMAEWDGATYRRRRELVERLEHHLASMGVPAEHPCWGTRRMAYLPTERQSLQQALDAFNNALDILEQRTEKLAGTLGLFTPQTPKSIELLCRAIRRAREMPPVTGIRVTPGEWVQHQQEVEHLLEVGTCLQQIRQAYEDKLTLDSWASDVLSIRSQLVAHGQKWWRFLIGDYRRAKTELAGLCRAALPSGYEDRLALVDAILDVQRLQKQILEREENWKALFGAHWRGVDSDWEVLAQLKEWMPELQKELGDVEFGEGLFTFLTGGPDLDTFLDKVNDVEEALRRYTEATDTLKELLELEPEVRFENKRSLHEQTFTLQREFCAAFRNNLDRMSEITVYNHLVKALQDENLQPIKALIETWPLAGKHLTAAFDYTWYSVLVGRAMQERPILGQFSSAAHESNIATFQELDKAAFHYNRARLAYQHWQKIQTHGSFGQMRILLHEMQKKRRHLPIRQLMRKAGNAIQAIKPVFMMSPMSIATYLPPGSISFDLVVFDEASQVRPTEAFGAILRGKQTIVVGDSKQLPPTNFFDVVASENSDEEENEDTYTMRVGDVESILGLFVSQGAPEQMLRWHYRSRHESLIAFSNHEFYNNRLVTFPSPDLDRAELGIRYHYLPDKAYDRGRSRVNRGEALVVAKAVMDHASRRPDWTLGVVAFSQAQAEAIQNQLEQLRREDPSLEHFFIEQHPEEPFFIKNLENVQGDERDVIFISVGYGRDQYGKLSLNFGPLNREGGERRLNVLITRARRRCEVFTNLRADDIDLSRTNAQGVISLKRFLRFAEHGQMETPEFTGGSPDSLFEEQVARAIRGLGYEVHHQVGSAGYFIDLAVVDPESPGRYLLGIECDGAMYHSARSARDRDRIRQAVLEDLGWHIHRIWSTDWFRNPKQQINNIIKALEEARSRKSRVEVSKPDNSDTIYHIERNNVKQDMDEEVNTLSKSYEQAILPLRGNKESFFLEPARSLAQLLEEVVRVESPVHFDLAARRILDTYGIKSLGKRIRERLEHALRIAVGMGSIKQKGDFLYDPHQQYMPIRNRAAFEARYKKLEFIADEEIDAALKHVVYLSRGTSEVNLPGEACSLLGFKRITKEMYRVAEQRISELLEQGYFVRQGEILVASEMLIEEMEQVYQ